jgi:hypothetical protein
MSREDSFSTCGGDFCWCGMKYFTEENSIVISNQSSDCVRTLLKESLTLSGWVVRSEASEELRLCNAQGHELSVLEQADRALIRGVSEYLGVESQLPSGIWGNEVIYIKKGGASVTWKLFANEDFFYLFSDSTLCFFGTVTSYFLEDRPFVSIGGPCGSNNTQSNFFAASTASTPGCYIDRRFDGIFWAVKAGVVLDPRKASLHHTLNTSRGIYDVYPVFLIDTSGIVRGVFPEMWAFGDATISNVGDVFSENGRMLKVLDFKSVRLGIEYHE